MDNKLVKVSKRLQENINFTILSDEISIKKSAEVISNKFYSIKIIDNQKKIDVDFTQSIGSTFALHNTDEQAHSNIVSLINENISDLNNEVNNKVDKIEGKALSTNDLTNLLKSNYDSAYTNSHTHNNKILIDNLTSSGSGNYYLTNDGTYKSASVGMIINALGSTSSNQTLEANKITTAAFNSTPTVSLPTVSDNTKEVTCILDFTTTNSSYPTISTTGISFKWSDKNRGILPSFSSLSGVRNRIIFKTIDSGSTWEAEYSSYGGVETTFTQPNLTSNGTFGGASFAVRADSEYYSNYAAWKASDGSISTYWDPTPSTATGHYYDWYNPVPIKVTQYNITNYSGDNYGTYAITAGNTYYSDDGNNWTLEQPFTNSVTTGLGNWSIVVASGNQGYHKYRRLIPTSTSNGYQPLLPEAKIAGYYITA